MRIFVLALIFLTALGNTALAQEAPIFLDCREKRDSGAILNTVSSQILRITSADGFHVWSDPERPFSGAGRTWNSWAEGPECGTYFSNSSGRVRASHEVSTEKLSTTCELWNSAGKKRTVSISIDRLDGKITLTEQYEGSAPERRTHTCSSMSDPQTISPPAKKF